MTVAQGGTGQSSYTDGQLLIGNTTGNTLAKATLTAGNGISITNGHGTITIANTDGYTLQGSCQAFSPADATTYYIGSRTGNAPTSTAASARVYIPRAGLLTSCYLFFWNGTTNGTTETSSAWIRLNNTTDTLISNSITNQTSAGNTFSGTGLGIAVAAGDYFEVKWTTPTWATNPAGTDIAFVAYITPTG